MGRPSKKAERLEQILQAFHRCVARFGLEGSTLERIAEESGLQRSLVRHFAGNREDLILQLAERVVERSSREWAEFLSHLPAQGTIDALLDSLFDDQYSDAEFVLVVESLIFAAGNNPALQQLMQAWMEQFSQEIESVLRKGFPDACSEDIASASFGLISLYFNLDSLAPLNMAERYRLPARRAAALLIQSLGQEDKS